MRIKNEIDMNRLMLTGLCIYRHLLADPVISAFRELADAAVMRPQIAVETFMERYSDFFYKLSHNDNMADFPHYIFSRLLKDENVFTISASNHDKNMNTVIFSAAASDIRALRSILSITSSDIKTCFLEENPEDTACRSIIENLPEWLTLLSAPSLQASNGNQPNHIKQNFRNGSASVKYNPADELWQLWNTDTTCNSIISGIVDYHAANGSGIFAGHYAFTWQRISTGNETNMIHPGYFAPVLNPDPVRLSDLIAYESEREEVIKNTEQFLNGYQANNVLLYGDRGTGKSSTVKALLNEYSCRGLRMIEVPKLMMADFPKIIGLLAGQPLKFIIFIDDLSFEDNEDSFTALKAVIEGGLEVKPQNVLIYATSNRKHLIRENFSDRIGLQYGGQDDEIRALDTMQEKLSLSDRFGITVVFSSPDKRRFLEIVDKLAQKKGIDMDTETLHKEALKWELWYNGRSPRTAQQFINHVCCKNNFKPF